MIGPFAGFTIVVVASKQKLAVTFTEGAGRIRQGTSLQLNFGSVGIGSSRKHLAREFSPSSTGVKLTPLCPTRTHRALRPDLSLRHRAARLPVVSERSPFRSNPTADSARGPRVDKRLSDHPGRGRPPPNPACSTTRMRMVRACLAPTGTPQPILERSARK